MKKFVLNIVILFSISSVIGQEPAKYLRLLDNYNNPTIGAIITFYNDLDSAYLTTRSDLEGIVYLDNKFEFATIEFIGFEKDSFSKKDLILDTTQFIIKEFTYSCPKLIIQKDFYKIDSTDYSEFIPYKIIEYHGDCSGIEINKVISETENYEIEKCDTLIYDYYCKLAVPKFGGFQHYYNRLVNYFNNLINLGILETNKSIVEFKVNRDGTMKIESIQGFPFAEIDRFSKKLDDTWKPAEMLGKPVITKYKMQIEIE